MEGLKKIRLISFLLGLVTLFIFERYLIQYDLQDIGRLISISLMLVGLILCFIIRSDLKSKGHIEETSIWSYALIWKGSILVGICFYIAYEQALGSRGVVETLAHKILLVAWLTFILMGLFAAIGVELGIRANGTGLRSESFRLKLSFQTWLGIGLLLGTTVCVNYVANRFDSTYDWSYLKTTEAGESTKKIAESLDTKVRIGAFFSRDSEVEPFVREYLEQLAKSSNYFDLEFYSKDYFPAKAEEFRVARDGQVVLMKGKSRQRVDLGEDLAFARKKLRKFDKFFQKALLGVVSEKKNVYVSSGHGEMSWRGNKEPPRKLRNFEKLLRSLNYNVRTLGAKQGGFSQVPEDASLVVIPGPSRSFSSQEVSVLRDYLMQGGNLLIYLDVEFSGEDRTAVKLDGDQQLYSMIENLGISFKNSIIANDKQFVRSSRRPTDHYFLYTNNFSTHPSMSSISKRDDKMGVITFQSGYLEALPKKEGSWKVTPIMETLNTSFIDLNKNQKFDGREKRQNLALAMAAESENSKVIVYSDATVISDPILLNPGNQMVFVDSIRWLIGQADYIGEISSEEDIKIQHSKSRDLIVFHGSIFLMPLLVLVFGYFATRRRTGGVS